MNPTSRRLLTPFLAVLVAATIGCGSSGSKPNRADDEVIVDEFIDIPGDQFEEVTIAPSSEHVWVPGYWERDPDHWTWVKGRWEKPPHDSAHWQKGHWASQGGRWRWMRGHWASGNLGWIVDDMIDVPALIAETKPAKPSNSNHWVPGYWEWNGKWIWTPGYWTSLPDPKATWVVGHWDEYGAGGWRWIAGHWRVS